MNLYADHAAQLDACQAEADDGTLRFTWQDKPYLILPGGAKLKRMNSAGGYNLSCDLQLTVTLSQFGGVLPDSGDAFNYNGKLYRIAEMTTSAGGQQARINADLTSAGL